MLTRVFFLHFFPFQATSALLLATGKTTLVEALRQDQCAPYISAYHLAVIEEANAVCTRLREAYRLHVKQYAAKAQNARVRWPSCDVGWCCRSGGSS